MAASADGGRTDFVPLQLHGPLERAIAALGAGRATLAHDSVNRYVWFDGGVVVAVTSSSDDEKLGSWLVLHSLVPPQTMRDALAAKRATERLGSVLCRAGLLSPEKLHSELRALAETLLGRAAVAGGELIAESDTSLPADARTMASLPHALLAAALRRGEDIEAVGRLLEQSPAWTCTESPDAPADTAGLDTSERYLLSLLKRPRTLDSLRRAALLDYTDLLRGVGVLAAAGLIEPCRAISAPPPLRSADGGATAPGTATPGGVAGAAEPAQDAPSGLFAVGKRNVREALAALDEAEASRLVLRDLNGQEASGALRHRVATLVDTATQLRDSGQDRRGARQMLARALDVFPAVSVMLMLADLELTEPHLRSQGLERLQRVLAKDPRSTGGWLMLARYWADRQQPDKVRACAAKILAYEPDNPDARALVAPATPPR